MSHTPIRFLSAIILVSALAQAACGGRTDEERVRLRLRYVYTASGSVTGPDSAAPGETVSKQYERHMRVEEVATEMTPRGNYLLAWTYHLPPDAAHGRETSSSEGGVPTQFTVHVEITPQGRIMDVANVETARPLFGDLDFRTYLEQTQPVFPDRPLEIGDSWTQEVKVLSPRAEPVVTSSTYILEDLVEQTGENVAVIAFDGDVYLPVVYESNGGEGEGLRSVEERVAVRGRMYFAPERGVVRRVESTAQASLIKVSFQEGRPTRSELQISQRSELRLETEP